jgi:FlaA1/EpsC-like NDP-sugar epimerase
MVTNDNRNVAADRMAGSATFAAAQPMQPTFPNLKESHLRYRAMIIVVGNLAIAAAAYFFSFALRFDLSIPDRYASLVLATLPILLGCKFIGFRLFGLFSEWWRSVSMRDLEDVVCGNVLASALFLSVMFAWKLEGFPRAVFPLDLMVCTVLMLGLRLTSRVLYERQLRSAVRRVESFALILGAGETGIRLLQEIERRPQLKVAVVGFLDDDSAKLGLRVCGVPVLGRVADLAKIVQRYEINEVMIAVPSAHGAVRRRFIQHCVEAGVRHRVLPTLGELVEGRVMYTQMREVQLEDLLAREPARLDRGPVESLVAGKTVLVTGAAGSIGSELCRQLAGHEPRRIVLYDRYENGTFALEAELRARFPSLCLKPVLGDILLPDQLQGIFAAERPEIVFHAAAYKHVPLAEQNVIEAVRNNILGTRNVAEAAIAHGTKEFVLVSTDKAVRPTSVMGVTKRVAELVVQGLQNGCCAFVAVRFGNVLGSSGSVVPLFREQIRRGGPVTVTDPEVTRYFMTIPEAAQLVLQAAALGEGGQIFVLEMGEPVRIVDLARQMIRLSGFHPDDIDIVFTGLRPGEKLHEELVADEEEIEATDHDRIRILRSNGALPAPAWLPALEAHVRAADVGATIRLLRQLVPSYRSSAYLNTQLDGAGNGSDSTPPCEDGSSLKAVLVGDRVAPGGPVVRPGGGAATQPPHSLSADQEGGIEGGSHRDRREDAVR